MRIANRILLVFEIIILFSFFYTPWGTLSFGMGLGDVFYIIFILIGIIIHFIWTTILSRRNLTSHYYSTPFITLLIGVIIILYLCTYGREAENRWDGHIFNLPCEVDIPIKNHDVEKTVCISMCSMEYYSEFSGSWDGKYMTIKNGEIKVPNELKPFLKSPIDKFEIESDYYEKFENDMITKEYDFNRDTLLVRKNYELAGEIVAIRNTIPVIKIRIRRK